MSALVVGIVMAGGKITKALSQGVVGDLTDRLGGKSRFIVVGAVLYAVGTVMIPFAEFAHRHVPPASVSALGRSLAFPPAFFVLFAAFAVCGVADSIRLPASMALFIEEGDAVDATAGSMSIRSVAWKLGQVVGPLVMGVVWDATGVFTAFAVAAATILASTGAFVVLDSPPTPAPS